MAEFLWRVPAEHPALAGHFPGRPIVPGVVLLDRALLGAAELLASPAAAWQVGSAKFLSPVGPGETLRFVLQTTARGGVSFVVHAADRAVASGSCTPLPP